MMRTIFLTFGLLWVASVSPAGAQGVGSGESDTDDESFTTPCPTP